MQSAFLETQDMFARRNKEGKLVNQIFERIENYANPSREGLKDFTSVKQEVEHIMPQKLNPWITEIRESEGSNAEKKQKIDTLKQTHEDWRHGIGNLTMLDQKTNPEMSNHPFRKKRDMPHGYAKSMYFINAYLKDCGDQWGEEQIKERAKKLSEKALEIWKYPK